jgi:hypothetical protein
LSINGVRSGLVRRIEGCGMASEVIKETIGASRVIFKHPGIPKAQPCAIEVGLNMSSDFYTWIGQGLANLFLRKDLALHRLMPFPVAGDPESTELQAVWRIDLFETLVAAVTVPPLDDAAGDARYLRIELVPELPRLVNPCCSGESFGDPPAPEPLLPSSFSVSIANVAGGGALDAASAGQYVMRADITQVDIGSGRDYEREPPTLEFADLTLRVREGGSTATDLQAWFTSFIIQGNSSAEAERTASLTVADASGRTLTLNFQGVGIVRFDPSLGVDGLRRADFYVESGTLAVAP